MIEVLLLAAASCAAIQDSDQRAYCRALEQGKPGPVRRDSRPDAAPTMPRRTRRQPGELQRHQQPERTRDVPCAGAKLNSSRPKVVTLFYEVAATTLPTTFEPSDSTIPSAMR